MRLILARHGNTFAAGDTVTWVGSRQDPDLTDEGRAQASRAADYLVRSNLSPAKIFCAPLKRTANFASLMASVLQAPLPIKKDARLSELDYGTWAGLSSDEIRERFGREEIDGWEKRSVWPQKAGWQEPEAAVRSRVGAFVKELSDEPDQPLLIVSSNGLLRYFLTCIRGAFEKAVGTGEFKMKTGHLSLLEISPERSQVVFWNKDPSQAP